MSQTLPADLPQTRDLRYRRLVVKAGTNLLTGGTDRLDLETVAGLVAQLARLRQMGAQVLLVTSGAVAVGRAILGKEARRGNVPFRQVLAAVGQGRLMHVYDQLFGWYGIPVAQALLTRRDVRDRLGYLNIRNTLLSLLSLGVLPIVNENDVVAVEELEGEVFGDNDTLAALVAGLVDADLLVLLTDTGGLYTADPHEDPNARLIPRVEAITPEVLALAGDSHSERSRGGMRAKVEAARVATASGTAVVIASGRERDAVVRLACGEALGTFFTPATTHLESRKRWMLSAPSAGRVRVDAGAVRALREQGRSLLPVGVVGVEGSFQRGDIVTVVGPAGEPIARGIANYGAEDLRRIQGRRSAEIPALLGHHYGDEVIHRNNLVLL